MHQIHTVGNIPLRVLIMAPAFPSAVHWDQYNDFSGGSFRRAGFGGRELWLRTSFFSVPQLPPVFKQSAGISDIMVHHAGSEDGFQDFSLQSHKCYAILEA